MVEISYLDTSAAALLILNTASYPKLLQQKVEVIAAPGSEAAE